MERACFVHKAHPNGDIGVILIVQAVNSTLSKEGTAGNGKGDGVCNAAFPPPVSAGNDRGVAEHQLCRLLIGLEARKHQAGNLKLLDLFQRIAPFRFSLNRCLRRPVLLWDDLVGFQHIKCHGILLTHGELYIAQNGACAQFGPCAAGEGRDLLAVRRSERNKRAAAAHTALYLGAQNHIAVCSLPCCALRQAKGDGAGSCRSALLYGLSLL